MLWQVYVKPLKDPRTVSSMCSGRRCICDLSCEICTVSDGRPVKEIQEGEVYS